MNQYELMINRLAQGMVPMDDGVSWFTSLSPGERIEAFRALHICCKHSHPLPAEVRPAICLAGLKPKFTPCVLLSKADIPERSFSQILGLPENEHLKAFRLLVALFAIADKRRRDTICHNRCNHEWHNIVDLQRSAPGALEKPRPV